MPLLFFINCGLLIRFTNSIMRIIIIVIVTVLILSLVYKSLAISQGDFTNISTSEIASLLENNPDLVLLDVRTPKETAAGKIKNALEVNVLSPNFSKKIGTLDKSKSYLVYCRSGKRSANACNIMSKQEFPKLYNLEGGYNAWVKAKK